MTMYRITILQWLLKLKLKKFCCTVRTKKLASLCVVLVSNRHKSIAYVYCLSGYKTVCRRHRRFYFLRHHRTNVYSVSQTPLWNFFDIFSQTVKNFSSNFAHLLYFPIYAGLQIFIQLTATLTKLCHNKRNHHNVLKMSTIDRNARWGVALNTVWHNFVTVGDNWIKICILAYIWTFNRRVKFGIKFITVRIKCQTMPACVSAGGGHFAHMMWTGWSRLIWHNFVKVADKIRNLA